MSAEQIVRSPLTS